MTCDCPFCETVHPIPPEPIGQELDCPCGATAWLCAPNTEPTTAVRMDALGYKDTVADVIDGSLSVVWGLERERWK